MTKRGVLGGDGKEETRWKGDETFVEGKNPGKEPIFGDLKCERGKKEGKKKCSGDAWGKKWVRPRDRCNKKELKKRRGCQKSFSD